MSDRISSFAVVIDRDLREEEAKRAVELLGMIVGVISVVPVTRRYDEHVAIERAKHEIREKLYAALEEEPK